MYAMISRPSLLGCVLFSSLPLSLITCLSCKYSRLLFRLLLFSAKIYSIIIRETNQRVSHQNQNWTNQEFLGWRLTNHRKVLIRRRLSSHNPNLCLTKNLELPLGADKRSSKINFSKSVWESFVTVIKGVFVVIGVPLLLTSRNNNDWYEKSTSNDQEVCWSLNTTQ